MKLKGAALISFFALALLLALSAQEPGGTIGWYNGDWQSGIPSSQNWYLAPDNFIRVYDQFQVPVGGWTVVSVFSDNRISDAAAILTVSWEIRRGMTPGNGGELVASGISPAIQSPDPAVTSPPYPASEVKTHFRIQAGSLRVQLAAGSYWISVTPNGDDTAFASSTLGANAAGLDANGPRLALVDHSAGPRFAIADSVARTGQVGRSRYFSQGVVIAR